MVLVGFSDFIILSISCEEASPFYVREGVVVLTRYLIGFLLFDYTLLLPTFLILSAIVGTSRCLFSDKYKTHKYSMGRTYNY